MTELELEDGPRTVELELDRVEQRRNISRTHLPRPDVRVGRQAVGMRGDVKETITIEQDRDRGLAGLDSIYIRGSSFLLEEGFRMSWRVAGR